MAAWTQAFVHAGRKCRRLEDLCLIGDLLKVRAVVDALLSRLAESAPNRRATMQLELAFLEIPVEPDEPSKGPGTDRSQGTGRRVGASLTADRANVGGKHNSGGGDE